MSATIDEQVIQGYLSLRSSIPTNFTNVKTTKSISNVGRDADETIENKSHDVKGYVHRCASGVQSPVNTLDEFSIIPTITIYFYEPILDDFILPKSLITITKNNNVKWKITIETVKRLDDGRVYYATGDIVEI